VVDLVAGLQSAQDRYRRLHRWLFDLHWLKAPLKRSVFPDGLAIFVRC
jgi:hypothetical protein